jgi:hypothetical protein
VLGIAGSKGRVRVDRDAAPAEFLLERERHVHVRPIARADVDEEPAPLVVEEVAHEELFAPLRVEVRPVASLDRVPHEARLVDDARFVRATTALVVAIDREAPHQSGEHDDREGAAEELGSLRQ